MEQCRVDTMEEFIDSIKSVLVKSARINWYRGQGNTSWNLLPGVKRIPYNSVGVEQNMSNRFILEAYRSIKDFPSTKRSQISLMQHYGLPTRLLDWSQSPIVALYFAVNDEKSMDSDGAVWMLQPSVLNREQRFGECVYLMNNSAINDLIVMAFNEEIVTSERIIACYSIENELRLYVQRAAFTIHDSNTPLDNLPYADEILSMIIIPSERKQYFKEILQILSVTECSLFPDLEHIAREFKLNCVKLDNAN